HLCRNKCFMYFSNVSLWKIITPILEISTLTFWRKQFLKVIFLTICYPKAVILDSIPGITSAAWRDIGA
ncbi:hypothetical protein TNCT_253391, partial [Trichonephila clavata]